MRTKIGLCLIIKSKYVLFDFDDDDLRSALFSFRFRFFVFFYSTANLHGFVFFLINFEQIWFESVFAILFFFGNKHFSFDTKLRSDFDIVYLPNFLSKRFCSRILSREIFHFLNCFPLLFFRFFCRRRRFFCKKKKNRMLLSCNFYIITAQSFSVEIA